MNQITGIGYSNFRVFSKPAFFNLASITIFTGTNSSGKSSIFKGLQLLKSNKGLLEELKFSGESHKLGTFQLAKNRLSNSDLIRFSIRIDNNFLLCLDYKSLSNSSESGLLQKLFVTKVSEIREEYPDEELFFKVENFSDLIVVHRNLRLVISEMLENIKDSDSESYTDIFRAAAARKNQKIKRWAGKIFSYEKLYDFLKDNSSISLEELIKDLDASLLDKLSSVTQYKKHHDGIDSFTIDFEDLLTESFYLMNHPDSLKTTAISALIENTSHSYLMHIIDDLPLLNFLDDDFLEIWNAYIVYPFVQIEEILNYSTQRISYIEAIRANSQRLYSNQSQGTSFNELLLSIGQNWKDDSVNGIKQVKYVEKWLAKFGIGDKILINRIKGIATEVSIEKEGAIVDLVDLGYGVTQFLPILLYVSTKLTMKSEDVPVQFLNDETGEEEDWIENNRIINQRNGPLLLIEEPESNLHPKLQSLLADFFIDVAKTFEVTLLIETHSEYLIRRLQVLTAAGEVKPEHSVIYYLDGNLPSDSDKFVRKININPDGSLTNDFGPGFIDEATNWKMELMRLKNAQLQNVN